MSGGAVAAVTGAPAASAVGLNTPAAGAAIAEGALKRSAHACAWFAAANLEAKGVPQVQPDENLSTNATRRWREARWRVRDAKLAAVYAHSVHAKRCALCVYTER